jgi:hypothetical protein
MTRVRVEALYDMISKPTDVGAREAVYGIDED